MNRTCNLLEINGTTENRFMVPTRVRNLRFSLPMKGHTLAHAILLSAVMSFLNEGTSKAADTSRAFDDFTLNFTTPCDTDLQARLEALDARLRASHGMTTNQTAVGLLDLRRLRLGRCRAYRARSAGCPIAWRQRNEDKGMRAG